MGYVVSVNNFPPWDTRDDSVSSRLLQNGAIVVHRRDGFSGSELKMLGAFCVKSGCGSLATVKMIKLVLLYAFALIYDLLWRRSCRSSFVMLFLRVFRRVVLTQTKPRA